MLSGCDVEVLTLKDVGFAGEIIEDGETFEENAEIKIRELSGEFTFDFIPNTAEEINDRREYRLYSIIGFVPNLFEEVGDRTKYLFNFIP